MQMTFVRFDNGIWELIVNDFGLSALVQKVIKFLKGCLIII